MSNIPKGHDLDNKGKLQNVVTGIILRECKPFSKEDIYTKLEKWCEGSPYDKGGIKRNTVNFYEMIEDVLIALFVRGCVRYDRKNKTYELDIGFPAIRTDVNI